MDDMQEYDPFDDANGFEDVAEDGDMYAANLNTQEAAAQVDMPAHLLYSEEHVWVDDSVDPVVCGVTAFASEQLGELVFIDFPEIGTHVEVGDELAQLESSKSVSPLISPVAGTVRYVNHEAYDDPSVVDSDPYGEGWLVKIELDEDPELLSADEYAKIVAKAQ